MGTDNRIITAARRGRAAVVLLLVVTLNASVLAMPGLAQEIGEPPPETDESDQMRLLSERLPTPAGAGQSVLHLWPEGRRGYLFTQAGFSGLAPLLTSPSAIGLVAVDLDTFEEVGRVSGTDLPWMHVHTPRGIDNEIGLAIDHEESRLYVPHHNVVGEYGDGSGSDFSLTETKAAENQALCSPSTSAQDDVPCFAGFYVLDADTLEVLGDLPFKSIGLEGSGVQLRLDAVSFAPPRHPGDRPKLHVQLAENVHSGVSVLSLTLPDTANPYTYSVLRWVAQIDALTGAVDWMEPVQACRGVYGMTFQGPIGVVFRNQDPGRPVVWTGCLGSGIQQSAIVAIDLDESDPDDPRVAGQRRFVGPGDVTGWRADPEGERILVKTATEGRGGRTTMWVFDGRREGFMGQLGVGPQSPAYTGEAIDPDTGRLYVYSYTIEGETEASSHGGGLGYSDLRRRTPPPLSWRPEFSQGQLGRSGDVTRYRSLIRLAVDPASDARPRRVFVRVSGGEFLVIQDDVTESTDTDQLEVVRSDDVPEAPGATLNSFDGSARGYGFRTILIGGLAGAVQPGGGVQSFNFADSSPWEFGIEGLCLMDRREAAFGLAGSPERSERALLDDTGTASATARAVHVDVGTEDDTESPVTRCGGRAPEWDELMRQSPVRGTEEPAGTLPGRGVATCALPDSSENATADQMFIGMTAEVGCDIVGIRGLANAPLVGVGPVSMGDARSSYEVERREEGGIVARVDSSVRELSIIGEHGAVHVDAIRSTVFAWANGRAQAADVADDINCDTSRTAGICYRRTFSDVTILDEAGEILFACEVCADDTAQAGMVQAMGAILGDAWHVRLPPYDPTLGRGTSDGAQVALLKPEADQFVDANLKGDLLPTVPALELVRVSDVTNNPGRQVFLFAGLEADLSYAISCLLEVVDGECVSEPGSLVIELTDPLGVPLPGGMFEVHASDDEGDADGALGLGDTLGDPLVCVTGPDGTCGFDTMQPGTYVVHQAVAPGGYAPMEDQTVDLPAGGRGTLTVVNGTLPVTGIAITLTDLDGAPLEGGEFEVHAGVTVADDAPLLAGCATDEIGVCQFPAPALDLVEAPLPLDLLPVALPDAPEGLLQVPAGAYTVRQASAPEGYEPVDDIPFDLPEGQIARVTLSNVPPFLDEEGPTDFAGTEAFAEPFAEPVAFAQPPPVAEPTFHVEFPDQPDELPMAAPGETDDSFGRQMVMLPGDAVRFALRHPKEALAFGGVMLLFAAAGAGAYRRRLVLDLLGP